MKIELTIFLYTFVFANMQETVRRKRFIEGYSVELGEFPYVAILMHPDGKKPTFGGTIIGPRHILTRLWDVAQFTQVLVGCLNYKSSTCQKRSVIHIVKPPRANFYDNDLAVLILHRALTYGSYVKPVNLSMTDIKPGMQLNLTGIIDENLIYREVSALSSNEENYCYNCYHQGIRETGFCITPADSVDYGSLGYPVTLNGELVAVSYNGAKKRNGCWFDYIAKIKPAHNFIQDVLKNH